MTRSRLLPLFLALTLCRLSPALADTYPRQPAIDVQHYTFRIAIDETGDEIRGRATVDVRFVQAGVTTIALDLASPTDGWHGDDGGRGDERRGRADLHARGEPRADYARRGASRRLDPVVHRRRITAGPATA